MLSILQGFFCGRYFGEMICWMAHFCMPLFNQQVAASDWQTGTAAAKAGWRSSTGTPGGRCVTTTGTSPMLRWSAGKWAAAQQLWPLCWAILDMVLGPSSWTTWTVRVLRPTWPTASIWGGDSTTAGTTKMLESFAEVREAHVRLDALSPLPCSPCPCFSETAHLFWPLSLGSDLCQNIREDASWIRPKACLANIPFLILASPMPPAGADGRPSSSCVSPASEIQRHPPPNREVAHSQPD